MVSSADNIQSPLGGTMHKNFYLGARLAARRELRKLGKGPFEIGQIMAGFENDAVDAAVAEAGPVPIGAFGDGTILKAILAFFESPLGQTIIHLLLVFLGL